MMILHARDLHLVRLSEDPAGQLYRRTGMWTHCHLKMSELLGPAEKHHGVCSPEKTVFLISLNKEQQVCLFQSD